MQKTKIKKLLLTIILLSNISTNTCESLNCEICCILNENNVPICINDDLKCIVDLKRNYDDILYGFILICIFWNIIPFFLFILNIFIIRRYKFLNSSICEFFIRVIINLAEFLICKKKKKKNHEIDNIDVDIPLIKKRDDSKI